MSEELPGDAREAAEDEVEVLSKPEHHYHKIVRDRLADIPSFFRIT